MGYRLEVTRRPVAPQLTHSERRSWRLHCRLSIRLTQDSLEQWRSVIERNLGRLRNSVTGQPHSRNLDRWESLVGQGDVPGLHRVLTGLDRDSIEMREVSPMGGLLPQDEREAALRQAADATRSARARDPHRLPDRRQARLGPPGLKTSGSVARQGLFAGAEARN
jgi:hypothetical protein